MARSVTAGRLSAGGVIRPRRLIAVSGDRIAVPDDRWLVHLQFRRFAGCPVCNLHLRTVVRRHDEIQAAGVREVVLFHSTEEQLRVHAGDLPFAIVADPRKRLYREFGVEASTRSLLHPRAWAPIVRAVLISMWGIVTRRREVPPIVPEGGRFGLPADFLIAGDGRIVACRYGRHAYDQWSVDELLDIVRAERAGRHRAGATR